MNPILEKIKKLLRMKRGGTQAEVETALALAAELAAKHGIDLAAVNPDEDHQDRVISHTDALIASRLQWECKYAALVVQSFFNVSFLLRRSGWCCSHRYAITFIGTATHTAIALHVYGFLVGHLRRSWNRADARLRNRQAFMYGMYHGICQKLAAGSPKPEAETNALILREDARRQTYMERTFGPTESETCKPDAVSAAATLAGYAEGLKTNILPAVRAPAPATLQIA